MYPPSPPITVWFPSYRGTGEFFVSQWTHFMPYPISPRCSIWHMDHSFLPQVVFSSGCLSLYPFTLFTTYLTVTFSPSALQIWMFPKFPSPLFFYKFSRGDPIISVVSITKYMPLTISGDYFPQIPISSLDFFFWTLVLYILFFFGEKFWSVNAQKSTKGL